MIKKEDMELDVEEFLHFLDIIYYNLYEGRSYTQEELEIIQESLYQLYRDTEELGEGE